MTGSETNRPERIGIGAWLLLGSLLLLAVCWWAMPWNLFPGLNLPVPATFAADPQFMETVPRQPLGTRLGFWIASKGWDSGPPEEFAYDFIQSWHLSLSAMIYLGIFMRLHRKARRHFNAPPLPNWIHRKTLVLLFLYPVLCTAVYWIFPLSFSMTGAHKLISLMIYSPLFWSMTLLTFRFPDRRLPNALIWAACGLIAGVAFATSFGKGGGGILFLLGITIGMVLWALVAIITHRPSRWPADARTSV